MKEENGKISLKDNPSKNYVLKILFGSCQVGSPKTWPDVNGLNSIYG